MAGLPGRTMNAGVFAGPKRAVRQGQHRFPALVAALMLLIPVTPRLSGTVVGGPNTWAPTGRMVAPLMRATATLLPDGKVLVVGVCGSAGCATSEVYDPRAGMWSATGHVTATFELASATLLRNGLVLVASGCDGPMDAGGCHIAALYNSRTGTWAAASPMNSAHSHPTATLLANGEVLVAGGQDAHGDATAAAELYDPHTNRWTATDDMAMPRAGHTATLLPDGRVLVAGGDADNAGVLTSAELYDPRTGTWSPSGSMSIARDVHTATLLPDGRVLVAGGEDASGARLDGAELYDPHTGTWSPTDTMTVGRANHTATLLSTGQVLVTGGNCELFQCDLGPPSHDAPLAGAELYNPATGRWTPTGRLMTARSGHTATVLATGQVLVAGGFAMKGPLADAELYTPGASPLVRVAPRGVAFGTHVIGSGSATDAVTVTNAGASPLVVAAVGLSSTAPGAFTAADTCRGAPIAPRESCAITVHFTPTATGDYSATLLLTDTAPGSPQSMSLSGTGIPASRPDTWAPAGHMADARSGHTATLLPDGRVLVAAASGAGSRYLLSAELFDPQTGIWTMTGRLLGNPQRNMGTTATLLATGQVLVAGSLVFPNAQLYTPSRGRWTPTGTMSTDRFGDTATLLRDGRVLVAGGCGDICGLRADAELYDPRTGRWTTTGSMATARMDHTATLLQNGDVLVAGGCNSCAPLSGAAIYHPRGDMDDHRRSAHGTLQPHGDAAPRRAGARRRRRGRHRFSTVVQRGAVQPAHRQLDEHG